MKPFPPLVFFGSDEFSAAVLERLLSHDDFKNSLKFVVTKTPRVLGRGRHESPTAVETLAKTQSDATIVYANTRAELDDALANLELKKLAPMGVLVSYGVIISQAALDQFPHGITNFHPSALPLYRGPSPIETAMLDGDDTLGLSTMRLTAAMDAGPIYDRTTISLRGDETRSEVYDTVVETGSELLYSTLRSIVDGTARPSEQDDSLATYTKLIKKEDGMMRPDIKTAEELEREVRTFLGFPKSRIELAGHQVIVTKAHVSATADGDALVVPCTGNTYLAIDSVIAPSGRTMSADAFLRGYAA